MTYEEKRALYERMMDKISKDVKKAILEAYAEKEIVVFSGKSKYFKGDAVEKFIEKNTDFKTSHTVNDKTSILITGEKPGLNKLQIAADNDIKVMSEDEFFSKYGLTDELPEKLEK